MVVAYMYISNLDTHLSVGAVNDLSLLSCSTYTPQLC